MANVTLEGNPHSHRRRALQGRPPGSDFRLTRGDLSDISLADFEGKVKILNIVPSLDTGVGAASARRFEKEAGDLGNVVVLRQLSLLQDTGDEDLQMLEWGSIFELLWAADPSHPGGVRAG